VKKILKLVQLSSNPISGSPYELNRLLQSSVLIESHFISGTDRYQAIDNVPERHFPCELLWNDDKEKCIRLIKQADIIHCHNTIFPENLKDYIQPHQKVIVQLYSVHRDALQEQLAKVKEMANIIVIADQTWQKKVYQNLSETYLPLVKTEFNNGKKSNLRPLVIYAPTNRYDLTHIYSKGYNEVISTINKLKEKYDFDFRLIEGVSYTKNLLLKREGDIFIDDIINENAFHGTSIEAAAYGGVPLTNYSGPDYPFYKTDLSSLENNLIQLISSRDKLQEEQEKIHKWFKTIYCPSLLKRYEQFYFYECLEQQIEDANNDTKDMLYAKYEIMKIMSEWLKKHEIFHFLSFGTALKAYRDREFATDSDFGLWYKDRWKVYNLLQSDPPEEIMINCIWRGEFTFRLKSRPYPKLDFIFFDKKEDGYHCYLYLRNPLTNTVSMERGLKISHKALSKFSRFKFCNQEFRLPKNIELYLDENYGPSWRCPKKQALGWGGRPCHNPEHREYAICMVTFMRDSKLKDCIESIQKYYPDEWVRLYIADQNESITEEMQNYYINLQSKGHIVVKTPYNSGLALGRNTLVNKVKEPYLLIIDDDFRFTEKTDLTKLKNILESKEDIGICGGKLLGQDPYLAWIYYNPVLKKILKIKTNYIPHSTCKTIQYPYRPFETVYDYSDIVLNFFLAKTEVFKDIQWDNNLVMVEHSDYFLRLKETKWKVVSTTEVECEHNHQNNSQEYRNFRSGSNRDLGIQRFCKKWNLNSLEDIYNIPPKFEKTKEQKKNPIIEIKQEPGIQSIIEEIQKPIESLSLENIFNEITSILEKLNLKYCLLQDTCKEAVLEKKISNGYKLHFGCFVSDTLQQELNNTGYISQGIDFKKQNIIVEFHNLPNQTKSWKMNNKLYQVPYPLISYLRYTFGTTITKELNKRGYNG
jgi:GT2 family glycosyltransferase